jgi:transcriptional regulator with XRE-family HTH domain
MARSALGWGVRDLAKAALVSTDTVARLERSEELKDKTLDAIREAFERNGVEFISENGGGPGVRLAKRKGKKRSTKPAAQCRAGANRAPLCLQWLLPGRCFLPVASP